MENTTRLTWCGLCHARCGLLSDFEDGASLGVQDGDWVLVQTERASTRHRVRVSDSLHPQTVDCQHGWWFPEAPCIPEEPYGVLTSNINVAVFDEVEACAKGTGAWQHTGIPCRVVRAPASG